MQAHVQDPLATLNTLAGPVCARAGQADPRPPERADTLRKRTYKTPGNPEHPGGILPRARRPDGPGAARALGHITQAHVQDEAGD